MIRSAFVIDAAGVVRRIGAAMAAEWSTSEESGDWRSGPDGIGLFTRKARTGPMSSLGYEPAAALKLASASASSGWISKIGSSRAM
jgi:hypothetical protein